MSIFLSVAAVVIVSVVSQPLSEQPFLGIGVRDSASGVVVSWIYPGPFGGTGFESSTGVRRADNVDAVYVGDEITPEARIEVSTAAEFKAIVDKLKVGDLFSIKVRRSPDADMNASIPVGGIGGDINTITVTVSDRDTWTGTIGRGLGNREILELEEGEFEEMILDDIEVMGLDEAPGGVDALLALFGRTLEGSLDPNMLSAVVQAFGRPFSLDEIGADLGGMALRVGQSPTGGKIGELITRVLDIPAIANEPDPAVALEMRGKAEQLVRTMRDSVYIYDDHATDHIEVIRKSPEMSTWWIGSALNGLGALGAHRAYDPDEGGWVQASDDVRAAVEGDIVAMRVEADGTIAVVGGGGPNVYDMSRVDHVLDLGGDDEYRWTGLPERARTRSFVVDRSGNDKYVSTSAFAGPGVGVFGLSVVEDYTGDDVYESAEMGSIGFGLFGIGLILDHAGDDRYTNMGEASGWSIGAGFYGVGLVVDVSGADVYEGEKLVQGAAGARGFGAIIDAGGADSYKADGPSFGSVYGTKDVFVGMSQGYAMGVRGYAAGGLGALWDLGGNDHYEAGEFSQACGYFFGMGILHDFNGDDVYDGNRYGQGTGAHQAVGLLVDGAGNDIYRSMTAASQGGTWDLTIGMLIDHGGNDVFEADGLAQGSAAMQAIGVLIDVAGDDSYTGKGASIQGHGGSNTYHYDAEKVFSFSGLFDLEGTDTYSAQRGDGDILRLGEKNEATPGQSSLYGLFDDQ
jgi:hypothetical protein